ncbi:hypothetical protein KP509_06G008700 [Ceratopteris richardii]|uniref:Two-component response regulator n=1 Tax=Ceratopteris richardii TaxID=49495 RepID=A0A8T2UL89_CERRI|nr:hypothetical protein KP509_06G008700 [Ceratopteris richardii]
MRRSGSGRPAFNQRTRQHMLETFSPTGLHVLVVDDDPLCLFVLEKMLKECSYRVTTCNEVNRALEILRENDDEFDLVISDVYLPQEDGFRLLEVIGLELDLPVIMISSNADVKVVMKGILHGACDYLIKPVRIEELRNIWQHVMRRRAGHAILRPEMNIDQPDDSEVREEGYRKRKDVLEIPDDRTEDINSSPKRARVNWSQQLHQQFVSAVNQLGIDKAVPKRILQIMNVQGLSRENVASHLQKYRLYLKRLSGVIPAPFPIASFQASDDGTPGGSMLVTQGRKAFEPPATVKGVNLGAGLVLKSGKVQSLDSGTIKSLSQFKFAQQKQAANRAQVLSAIGIGALPSYSSSSQGGLYRMASIDVSTLSAATPDSSPGGPSTKVADELASIKLEEDVVSPTPVLGGLARTQSSMEGCIPHLGAIVGCIKQQGSRSSHPSTTIGEKIMLEMVTFISFIHCCFHEHVQNFS